MEDSVRDQFGRRQPEKPIANVFRGWVEYTRESHVGHGDELSSLRVKQNPPSQG